MEDRDVVQTEERQKALQVLPRSAFEKQERPKKKRAAKGLGLNFSAEKSSCPRPIYLFRFGAAGGTGPEDTLGRKAWKRLPVKGLVRRNVAPEEIVHLPLNCRFDVADFEIVWINHLMRASKDGPLEEQDMTHKSTSCTCGQ